MLNGDGHPDVVVMYSGFSCNQRPMRQILVFLGDGKGDFTTDNLNTYFVGTPNSGSGLDQYINYASTMVLGRLQQSGSSWASDGTLRYPCEYQFWLDTSSESEELAPAAFGIYSPAQSDSLVASKPAPT